MVVKHCVFGEEGVSCIQTLHMVAWVQEQHRGPRVPSFTHTALKPTLLALIWQIRERRSVNSRHWETAANRPTIWEKGGNRGNSSSELREERASDAQPASLSWLDLDFKSSLFFLIHVYIQAVYNCNSYSFLPQKYFPSRFVLYFFMQWCNFLQSGIYRGLLFFSLRFCVYGLWLV